ncbi:MAG: DUF4878 domain-containing protein [Bacteroidales bacterium]|nr:DUF4878 domain-containing protein [Bacteroidales bacterium]
MSKFILRINAVVAGLVILAGCGGSNEKAMGPEETVEAFCRAVTAGQWSQAEALCDTVSMKAYLDSHKEAWETLQREDSCALAIAESILADTVMTVEEVSKEEDRRVVSYTLAADGNSKTRKATLKKEEGAWRVERITDAN